MSPISFNFAALLNSCTSLPALKRVHTLLFTFGLSRHIPFTTKLLSLASRLSPTAHYARQLFDAIPHPDSFLCNTLLRAYSDLGPIDRIFPLYSRMHNLDISPDHFTFPFVLRSCGIIINIQHGRQAHCNVVKHGFDTDIYVGTALILMYSNCGEIPDSELVFENMEVRNVVLWTSMIAGYVQNSVFSEAMFVFRAMERGGVRPNEVTLVSVLPTCNGPGWLRCGESLHGFAVRSGLDDYVSLMNALVSMYGKCGNVGAARCLFDGMRERTLVSWNAMVALYEQHSEGFKAIGLFSRMVFSEKVGFNAVTLVSVLSACASTGALDTGKWVHELARCRGLETDVRVCNALLDMYSKCGNLDSAREIFERLQSKGVVSWSAMVGAYASHGHAQEALELFDRMKAEGVRPNSFTFTAVLTACSHSGFVDDGIKNFDSMRREYGIIPTLEHCACKVDLLGRAGRLREAYDFVKEMEVKPDTAVWGALLGSCRIHGNVEMAELVVDYLFTVEPHNVTFYVLMSSIYADAGRWVDAERMRRLIKEQELKKMPGCSSVKTLK